MDKALLRQQKDAVALDALKHYGEVAQVSKASEELSELAAVLSRITTSMMVYGGSLQEQYGSDFYGELADVKLLLASIEQGESFNEEAYLSAIDQKVKALYERISRESND